MKRAIIVALVIALASGEAAAATARLVDSYRQYVAGKMRTFCTYQVNGKQFTKMHDGYKRCEYIIKL